MTKRMIEMEIQEPSRKCSFVICIENNSFIVNNQSAIKKIQSIILSLPTSMINCNPM